MDRQSAIPAVPNSDMPFIYVDLQNPDDWEKIEMILTEEPFPLRTPGEQTPAPGAGRHRQ